MEVFTKNIHPIFEADQVLTSDHLNDMFDYLEEQGQLTRAKLIGSGIVCGLEISLRTVASAKAVVLKNGVGLSSKGYIVPLSNEDETHPYFTVYTDPNEAVYPFFNNGNSGQINLYELQNQPIATAEPLVNLPAAIEEYAVLLYLECRDKKLKNCIENDCNEKGIERIFTIRKLLVSKADMRAIICREKDLNVPKSEQEIDEIVNERFYLQPIVLQRFRTGYTNFYSTEQFANAYRRLIKEGMSIVNKKIAALPFSLRPIFLRRLSAGQFPFLSANNGFPSKFFNFKISAIPVCYLQYTYDFLRDVAATYNELIDVFFDLYSECCLPFERFPKHLRLGDLANVTCTPSPYRTTFTSSPILNQQSRQKEKVVLLTQKLNLLLTNFELPTDKQKVIITPSSALSAPLSQKAIPYYYNLKSNFLKNWNPDLGRKCRQYENLAYRAIEYAKLPHILQPLAYNTEKYDSFRIEGHICRNYRTALKEIVKIRRSNNLAFDVVALKLSNKAQGTDFTATACNFKDLEVLCHAWKSELECLLGETVKKISSLNVREPLLVVDAVLGEVVAEASPVSLDSTTAVATAASNTRARVAMTTDKMIAKPIYAATVSTEATSFTVAAKRYKKVENSINKDPETLGHYINKATEIESNICKWDSVGSRLLQDDLADVADFQKLGKTEYTIAYLKPFELSILILDLAKELDKNCYDLDISVLEKKVAALNKKAGRYIFDLKNYHLRAKKTVKVDAEKMLTIARTLASNCSLKALKEIKEEMKKRKEKIMQMNLFAEYVKTNPGISHFGGVPKAGTFIILYSEQEASNYTIKPGVVSISPNFYSVSGKLLDDMGEPLIGASVLVKSSATGTVTDLDGKFKMNISKGEKTLIFSYTGYADVEVNVKEASYLTVEMRAGGTSLAPGTVIGDFYLPYLCCSDCPPVTYVFPPEEKTLEEKPEDPVNLSLRKESYCLPDKTLYAFTVAPEDGVVTGEGVVEKEGKYFFVPSEVGMEDEVKKVVGFKVNDKEVTLEVRVLKEPLTDFDCRVVWSIPAGKKHSKPELELIIRDFDPRLKYLWTVKLKDRIILQEEHKTIVPNPDMQAFWLPVGKEGMEIEVELQGVNEDCIDTTTKIDKIPTRELPEKIVFQVFLAGKEVKPPYVFAAASKAKLAINVIPTGKFEENGEYNLLRLENKGLINNGTAVRYTTELIKQRPGDYKLTYQTENQEKNLEISLQRRAVFEHFTHVPKMMAFAKEEKTIKHFKNAKELEESVNLSNTFFKRMSDPNLKTATTKGEFNKKIAETLVPLMTKLSDSILELGQTDAGNNTAVQDTMLQIYLYNLQTLMDMIVLQVEDSDKDSLLFSALKEVFGQMLNIRSKGIEIRSKRAQKTYWSAVLKKLEEKPLVRDLINKFLKK